MADVNAIQVPGAMRIRHLHVSRFRGISGLDWTVKGGIVCLVGPGDGFKTTVLEAIEWVLWPRWGLAVTDADFLDGDTSQPIVIEVTVSPVPLDLQDDRSYGTNLRGWSTEDEELQDEPIEGCEPALTVRFEVDGFLEPTWRVVNDRLSEGKPIRAVDRERLGAVRIGDQPGAHFGWGRGSGLTRLAASVTSAEQLVAEVMREARGSVAAIDFADLDEALGLAARAATAIGAGVSDDELNVQLDPRAAIGRASSLSLHIGDIPVGASGLGTRRLMGIAIQSLAVADGAMVLVDEVESGLEPHRLRHLIRVLRDATTTGFRLGFDDAEGGRAEQAAQADGQVFMTTHSPVAICELRSTEVHVVRPSGDGLTIKPAGAKLQALVRSQPEALLGRSVVVCEGKTEVGLIRGLQAHWASENHGVSLAEKGVVLADGGGIDKAAGVALRLAELGYRCMYFADSDHEPTPTVGALGDAGVEIVRWAGAVCTEERLATDIPEEILGEILGYLVGIHGVSVLDLIGEELGLNGDDDPYDYIGTPDVVDLRIAIATRTGQHGWLKRIDWAEGIGRLLAPQLDASGESDLNVKLSRIQTWANA